MDKTDAQVASLSLGVGLTDLPLEIQQLIINHLAGSSPLWAPRYADKDIDAGRLSIKRFEYYGRTSARARALMSWSTCSRQFRELLIPIVFKTVVLRSRPKSMASIRTIQRSAIWSHVQELRFAGTWTSVPISKDPLNRREGQNRDHYVAHMIESEMAELETIFEHLPPNISTLSLDFPQGWDRDHTKERLAYNSARSFWGESNRYDAIRKCVLSAVSKNDISTKGRFHLKILGLIPLHIPQPFQDELSSFLRNVTSLTLGMCCYVGDHPEYGEIAYCANTFHAFQEASELITPMFLNHLHKATSLEIRADRSWPLGLSPVGRLDIEMRSRFQFPTNMQTMPYLSVLVLKNMILTQDLIDFLILHKDTLTSVELIDCSAFAATDEKGRSISAADAMEPPLEWRHLFEALATAKLWKLCDFAVINPGGSLGDLIDSRCEETDYSGLHFEKQQIEDRISIQVHELNNLTDPTVRKLVEWKFRKVLSYSSLHSDYGTLLNATDTNIEQFLAGQDHASWLRVVEMMERNLARNSDHLI